MRLNNKLYCDVCCKRIDNYTEPAGCLTYSIANQERHYCKKHGDIGGRLLDICKTYEDVNNYEVNREKVKEYDEKLKKLYCSNVGVKPGTENCNYCIIRKSCGALKEAKRLKKREGDKNMWSNDPNKVQVDWTKVKNQNILPLTSCDIPMPAVKLPKKERIKRVYEDDNFIIDLFPEEPMVRVSIFKDNHFQDEVFVRKDDYLS